MKVHKNNIQGEVIRDTEVYRVSDNKTLNHLILSETILHGMQETSGHSHEGKEEIYFFQSGEGYMMVDEEKIEVKAGDVILIPDGAFHKVFNTQSEDLIFLCVFENYTRGDENGH